MLSLSAVGKSAGMSYYQKEDYYFRGQAGIVVLGQEIVEEKLTKEQFEKLVDERINETRGHGNNQKEHKIAEDLTFSAPKSVSITAALDKEAREKIFQAHQNAVQAVMNYIESSNMIQTRENGKPTIATEAIAARFDHFTSRNGDPQLHSHVLLLNRVRNENGELRATYLREIYENKIAFGTMYRLELASNLEKLGYQVEWKKDGIFELKGFSEEQLKAFSSRRQEIEKALAEKGLDGGGKAAEVATLDTRKAKQEYNIKKLEESWEKTAKELNIQVPQPNQEQQKLHDKVQETIKNTDLMNITQEVVTRQIETAGFTQQLRVELELAKALAKEGHTTNISQIRELAKQGFEYMQERDQGLVDLGTDHVGREWFTTNDVLHAEIRSRESTQEREALEAQKTQEILDKFNQKLQETKGFKLDDYQLNAAKQIAISNHDGIIIGKAGAGKTTLMQAIKAVYEQQGKEIIGVAPTGAAAQNLQKEANITSYTIDSLAFQNFENIKDQLKGGLIIIDEAGMLDARRDAAVHEFAEKYGMKILRVGDPDQIKPVAHGDPFSQKIQEELKKGDNIIVLDKIYRQKEKKYRDVALKAAIGKTVEALEQSKQYGWVKEITARGERIQAAAKEYLQNIKEEKNTLLVTESNALKNQLNKEIRYTLKKEGLLQDKDKIEMVVRGTDGKKIGEREFVKGDMVQFLRNNKEIGVMNGQIGKILNIDSQKHILTVKVDDEIKNINYDKYNYIDHGYAVTVHKSQGQTVDKVIYVNDTKKSKMTNSNLFYVALSRGREAVTIYTDNLEKLKEKIQNAQEKRDVLEWKVKHEQKQQKDNSISKNNVIDQNKYNTFKAQDKIRQAINESATRLTWYDMNMQQKRDFVSSVLERQQAKEEIKQQTTTKQQKIEQVKEKIEEKANKSLDKLELYNINKNKRKEITQNVVEKLHKDVVRSNFQTYLKHNRSFSNKQTYNKTYNKSNILSFLIGNYYRAKYHEALKTGKDVGMWAFFAGKTMKDIREDRKAFELVRSDRSMFLISLTQNKDIANKVRAMRASYAVKKGDIWNAWKYGGFDRAVDATIQKVGESLENAIKDGFKKIKDGVSKIIEKLDEREKRQLQKETKEENIHKNIDKDERKDRTEAAKEVKEEIQRIKEEKTTTKEKIDEKLNQVDKKIENLSQKEETVELKEVRKEKELREMGTPEHEKEKNMEKDLSERRETDVRFEQAQQETQQEKGLQQQEQQQQGPEMGMGR